jgi:twitching motility protein PilT
MAKDINELLRLMAVVKASDLHLKVPSVPVIRIDGIPTPQEKMAALSPADLEDVFQQITTSEQRAAFNKQKELDFAYTVPGLARFRVNALRQRGNMSLAFRMIPFQIPSIEELGLPAVSPELVLKPRGLILVTGPTGSGKSTTLAALINYLNDTTLRTVITIEDPIEFIYEDRKCLIAQRELGDDTHTFGAALKHAMRHDPDVLVIGEMRDLETISTAIMAAETGHLVLATLHTIDAAQTVDRIIDVFPHDQQRQIRLQLAQVIQAIMCQTLLPKIGGGRAAAFEVMLATSAIRKLIHDEKIWEIPANMELSTQEGMQTLEQALAKLVKDGHVTLEDAQNKSNNKAKVARFLQYLNET